MSKELVAIKGILGGLAIIVNSQMDLDKACQELTSKLKASNSFFRGAYFTIAFKEQMNAQLVEKLIEVAESFGLIYSEGLVYAQRNVQAATQAAGIESLVAATVSVNEGGTSKEAFGLTASETNNQTLLISHSLRSGQHINYDGSVVVLGDVNPGAEVIASGSIVVMGTLRGIAHAGASGNPTSKIVAYRLMAKQIRIGNQIGRAPDDQEQTRVATVPEVARLGQDGIILEQYGTSKRVTAL